VTYVTDPAGVSFSVKSLGADGQPGGASVDRDLSAPIH